MRGGGVIVGREKALDPLVVSFLVAIFHNPTPMPGAIRRGEDCRVRWNKKKKTNRQARSQTHGLFTFNELYTLFVHSFQMQ